MHHALVFGSRIVAGMVAIAAFYFAFFLYEDEEGVWQNRVENLWTSIYDRAKVTNSTATALFNKIGETLNGVFSRIFGTKLLSFQAAAISVNLSLGGAFATAALVSLLNHGTHSYTRVGPEDAGGTIACVVAALLFFFLASLPVQFRKKWATVVSSLPIIAMMSVSVAMFVHQLMSRRVLAAQPLVLLLSFLSDYFAVVFMRKLFASISQAVSVLRITLTMIALLLFAMLIAEFPFEASFWMGKHYQQVIGLSAQEIALELLFFNVATAIICLIPAVMLVFVLLHRLIWPTLSRLLYPIASRRLITNRKVLVSVGSLSLLFAFNLERVGAKEILKLLS